MNGKIQIILMIGDMKMNKNDKWYWYHYDNRGKMNNDYPYNQYDEEEYHEQE